MPTMLTRQAAKFWVALVGVVTGAVLAAVDDAPRWLFVVNAAVAAIAVYLVPNQEPPEQVGRHEKP